MTKERKELIVLDGLTILFVVMLVSNGVLLSLLYRWHNGEVFKENVRNRTSYTELLAEVRALKNRLVEIEGAETWEKSRYGKELAFQERGKKTFTTYGLSVDYPSDYASQISKDGEYLVLMTQEEAGRLRDPKALPSEGPTTITVDAYPLEGKTLLEWIESSKESNFDREKGEPVRQSIGGLIVLGYSWSGLYEATSYAVEGEDGHVVLLTVTYLSRTDDIVRDSELVLSTLRRS